MHNMRYNKVKAGQYEGTNGNVTFRIWKDYYTGQWRVTGKDVIGVPDWCHPQPSLVACKNLLDQHYNTETL